MAPGSSNRRKSLHIVRVSDVLNRRAERASLPLATLCHVLATPMLGMCSAATTITGCTLCGRPVDAEANTHSRQPVANEERSEGKANDGHEAQADTTKSVGYPGRVTEGGRFTIDW